MATCGRDKRVWNWCVVAFGFLPLTFGGSTFADIIYVPGDYDTIQWAIDACVDGDGDTADLLAVLAAWGPCE